MFGGTYREYLDTPEAEILMRLRIEEMYAPPAPAPLGTEPVTPTIS